VLIPAEIDKGFYCAATRQALDVKATGTIVIGRLLKPTNGHRFSQEIHVENLKTSFEVQAAIELDAELHQEILMKLIANALETMHNPMETKI
jgi:hypothetical protein